MHDAWLAKASFGGGSMGSYGEEIRLGSWKSQGRMIPREMGTVSALKKAASRPCVSKLVAKEPRQSDTQRYMRSSTVMAPFQDSPNELSYEKPVRPRSDSPKRQGLGGCRARLAGRLDGWVSVVG